MTTPDRITRLPSKPEPHTSFTLSRTPVREENPDMPPEFITEGRSESTLAGPLYSLGNNRDPSLGDESQEWQIDEAERGTGAVEK